MTRLTRWIAGGALALLAPLASAAVSTVLTFDDLGDYGQMPSNYGGLDWSAGGWWYYTVDNEPYTPASGTGRVTLDWYESGDAAAAVASTAVGFAAPVVFDGAYFAGLSGAKVSFDLYLDGSKVWSSATLDPSAVPTFLASGYAGLVDKVVVNGPALYAVVMDDFSFTAAVPEPGSVPLMLAGLAGVGLIVRRRAMAV